MPTVKPEKKPVAKANTNNTKKSFFKDDTNYTEEGAKLSIAIDKFMEEIYKNYYSTGYPLREIQQLVNNSTTTQEMKFCVKKSEEIYTDKRKERLAKIQASVNYNENTE